MSDILDWGLRFFDKKVQDHGLNAKTYGAISKTSDNVVSPFKAAAP